MKMSTEEAFVKVLQRHGIEHAFGIIGSAMMPISDLFPAAGIKFWDCAHEVNAGMSADGFTRASGKMCMAIAQNGPGITNFVTPIKTAYWNHTPLLLVTPHEVLNRVIEKAWRACAPAQINVPRDFWTQVIDIELPQVVKIERPRGGENAITEAANLLSKAEFPVILNGAGVVLGGAIDASRQLAEKLDAPVCCNYQHTTGPPMQNSYK